MNTPIFWEIICCFHHLKDVHITTSKFSKSKCIRLCDSNGYNLSRKLQKKRKKLFYCHECQKCQMILKVE